MQIPDYLILKQYEIGPMRNFIYFIGDRKTGEVAVVDPAWDVDQLRATADKNNWQIRSIFLTHGHPDHVNGLSDLLATHDVPVYISRHEADFFTPQCKNLHRVEDGDRIHIGAVDFEAILTPGHSPGCLCFKHYDSALTGDALFIDGCGRCDLPGGDPQQMFDSLYNIILKWPEETVLYPGHNYGPKPSDTLAGQKRTNPYLQCHDRQEFLQQRMGVSA